MKTYCVKERKQTESIEPSGYETIETEKGSRRMFWSTCASCGIKKYKILKNKGN